MSNTDRFVAAFADFWRRPAPERMPEILHADIVLLQPLAAPMLGIEAAQAEFRRLWHFLPDLQAKVDRWRGEGELLFVEFRLCAHMAGEYVEWPVIDRFLLRDGKAVERVTYFDPLPVLLKVLRHPSIWWRWWRSGAARPWRSGSAVVRPSADH